MSESDSSVETGRALLPQSPELRQRDERLAALRGLAMQLTHDFNNALTPLLGYAAILRDEVGSDSAAVEYLDLLEGSARRTGSLLNEFLASVRPERSFKPEPIDFAELLEQELTRWHGRLPNPSEWNLRKDLRPGRVVADAAQWRAAIQLLLANAAQAACGSPRLEVSLQPVPLLAAPAAELGVRAGEALQLRIRDYGRGMPPEVCDRAFDPVFSTSSKGQTKGAGLMLVHSVTRQHGGQVVLESNPNLGTTVTIWLPCQIVESGAPSRIPTRDGASPKRAGRKILVADDDDLVLEVLKMALARLKMESFFARDGHAAWELYQEHSAEVGLILSDIAMPRVNGIELMRRVRQVDPSVPVVLISGNADLVRDQELTPPSGPLPFLLKKPFSFSGLLEVIRGQMGGPAE
jgi:CheY-like chemotaxis protein